MVQTKHPTCYWDPIDWKTLSKITNEIVKVTEFYRQEWQRLKNTMNSSYQLTYVWTNSNIYRQSLVKNLILKSSRKLPFIV